jgi:hypothetical protein
LNEHASIAAFNRFSLQLLQLGAPASLLADAQRATLDEIDHAQRCFALASRFAGRTIGPSSLELEGLSFDEQLPQIVKGTLVEGCFGETLAALEAAEAARHAKDPQVRASLERIADDEARHAALAWRFIAWVLVAHDPSLRTLVTELFQELLARESDGPTQALTPSRLTDFGVLPERYRHSLAARALCDVIIPCAHALLQEPVTAIPTRGGARTSILDA